MPSHTIDYLAHHPHHVETVGTWIWDQWDRDNGWSQQQCIDLLRAQGCHIDQLDVTLVAVNDNQACVGTIQLMRDDFLPDFQHLSPWVGSFYVVPGERNGHLALELSDRIEAVAAQLGYVSFYAHTTSLQQFFVRRGGIKIGESLYSGKKVDVFQLPVRQDT